MLKRCMGCMEKYDSEYEICPYCGYVEGTSAKEEYHIIPGSVLVGRYIIGRVLGFGGFGVTYLGWDKLLEKKVAIKEYLPSEFATRVPGTLNVLVFEGDKTEQFNIGKEKFSDEAKRLALFNNESGIVTVYDEFEDNDTAYLVMEFFEGETVAELVKREGKIPYEKVIEIMLPILTSLQEVHDKGIIHRDIAPDNIFITKDNKIKLLDFGAARYATSNYSKSLSVLLKPGYAPEEQYRSRGKQGPWSDVYAIGATMYYMLTNIVPQDAMERLGDDKLKQPKKLINVSNNLNNAIMNALVIDAEQRTQSVKQLKDDILNEKETILKKERKRKREIGSVPRWAKYSAVVTSSIIVVLCVLIGIGVIDTSAFLGKGNQMDLGEDETFIPGLLNEYIDDAKEIAIESDINIQIVDKVLNKKVEANKVLTQSPEAGLITIKGAVINLVVSKGEQQIIVPDVSYMYKQTAKNNLEQLGFKVKIKEVDDEDFAADSIVKQSVEAGEEYGQGGKITLSVAKEKDKVKGNFKVPKIEGKKFENAVKTLREKGAYIVISERKESDEVKEGYIISQSIEKGKKIKKGSVIEVVVSTGTKKTQVPDVQFQDKEEAVKILESLGFKVKIKEEESDFVSKGKVISQSTKSGKLIKAGSTVTLIVSKGSKEIDKAIAKTEEYNNTTGSGVTEKLDTPEKKEWSDWTLDTSLLNNNNYNVETKKQYSSRERTSSMEYTTSTNDGINGWEKYDSQTSYTAWSGWSGWSRSSYGNSDIMNVESRVVTDSNAYSYNEYHRWRAPNGNCAPYQNASNANYLTINDREFNFTDKRYVSEVKDYIYCAHKKDGTFNYYYYGKWNDGWYFKQTVHVPAVTHTEWRYRTRSKITTNYFRRKVYSQWGNWSYWHDNEISGASDLKEIQSRTVYRYKKK